MRKEIAGGLGRQESLTMLITLLTLTTRRTARMDQMAILYLMFPGVSVVACIQDELTKKTVLVDQELSLLRKAAFGQPMMQHHLFNS
jgi:hypothetical protein